MYVYAYTIRDPPTGVLKRYGRSVEATIIDYGFMI
jgi:hypothetical protein